MRNKLSDLNNILFSQLEKLSDEDLKGDALKEEMKRAKTMSQMAGKIIENAKLAIDAMRMIAMHDVDEKKITNLIGNEPK